jgi:MoaA/NifB/PqqE/SkfB family radical SAM enzyme
VSSRFLKKDNGFCVLPFIERHRGTDGKEYFCCYSRTPIDRAQDPAQVRGLLSTVYQGNKIDHCRHCYQIEESGAVSPRLQESARWLRDPDVSDYIEKWQPDGEEQIFYYDLRYDNKCNLACISCNPTSSSLWARELGVENKKITQRFDPGKCLSAKKIYMAGGEPLIIDEMIDVIDLVSRSVTQPELVINTNLTRVNDDIKQNLAKIRRLTLVVSVDSFGSVNEYHRWPSVWDKFLNNLQWARSIPCNIMFNTVVDAVSVIDLAGLLEIEHMADQWNLTILDRPAALHIENLPEQVKQQVYDRALDLKQSRFYQTDRTFKSRVDVILEKIPAAGNPDELAKYITELDQRRNIDHKHYLRMDLT